jgi:dipeptidyl aminopeptidase/acylaminoacyl peptidase
LYRRGRQAGCHYFISEEDLRCPIEQAEQRFGALQQRRREVRLVRFPGENHELSHSGKPSYRLQRFGYLLDWFGEKLAAPAEAVSQVAS